MDRKDLIKLRHSFEIPDFPGKIKGSFLLILFKIYSRNISLSSNILIDDQLLDHNT